MGRKLHVGRGSELELGTVRHRVREDAGVLVFRGDAEIWGVGEFWKGYQGSSDRPPGSAWYRLDGGALTPVGLSEVPDDAYYVVAGGRMAPPGRPRPSRQ